MGKGIIREKISALPASQLAYCAAWLEDVSLPETAIQGVRDFWGLTGSSSQKGQLMLKIGENVRKKAVQLEELPRGMLEENLWLLLCRRAGITANGEPEQRERELLLRLLVFYEGSRSEFYGMRTEELIDRLLEKFLEDFMKRIEEMQGRLSPEQEAKFLDALGQNLEKLSREEKEAVIKAWRLDALSGEALLEALRRGTKGALVIGGVQAAGFGAYLALTTVVHAFFTTLLGITLPFAFYTGLTTGLSWLIGPLAPVLIAAIAAGGYRSKKKSFDYQVLTMILVMILLYPDRMEENSNRMGDDSLRREDLREGLHFAGRQFMEMMAASPLRRAGEFPGGASFMPLLERAERDISLVLEGIYNPLFLVFVGEVKAGKSTLINVLAGGEVSPVDVLECTAAVLEIDYALRPHAEVHKKDGTKYEVALEEIKELFAGREAGFAADCRCIRVGYPLANLTGLRLVDTPGLATLNKENENTTLDYIMASDVLVWVFNASSLGDLGVKEKFLEAIASNKPVVLAVNRLDEVGEENRERVIEYVNDSYGFYFEDLKVDDVFAFSAGKAWEALLSDDEGMFEESGIVPFIDYLHEKLEKKAEEIKEEALILSLQELWSREYSLHRGYLHDYLENMGAMLERQKERLKALKKEVIYEVREWLKARIYGDGQNPGFLTAGEKERLSRCRREGEIRGVVSQIVGRWWDETSKELEARVKELWKDKTESVLEDIVLEWGDFFAGVGLDRFVVYTQNKNFVDVESLKEKIVLGGIIGGLAGAVLAAFTALTLFPTVLLTVPLGALIWGAKGYLENSSSPSSVALSARVDEGKLKKALLEEVEARVLPRIDEASEVIIENIVSELTASLVDRFTPKEVAEFKKEVCSYIEELELFAENLKKGYGISFSLSLVNPGEYL